MENILSMLIFFPAAAATVGFLIEKDSMRQYGVVVTVVEFVLSLLLWYYFDTNATGMQFVQMLRILVTNLRLHSTEDNELMPEHMHQVWHEISLDSIVALPTVEQAGNVLKLLDMME